MKKQIRIDIVSDVVCPWCIVGYKQLEHALAQLDSELEAEIHWHPFQINPDIPAGGKNLRDHLAAKYGTEKADSVHARDRLTQIGAELGVQFDYFDEMKTFNTFKAHQLLHYARLQGKENELKLRLFSAFFGERKTMDDDDTLVAEAEAVGLDGETARALLQDQRYANEVRAEQQFWQQRGVRGVPTVVFNEKFGVSGAQGIDAFRDLLLQYAR